jgi:hypothetical protein
MDWSLGLPETGATRSLTLIKDQAADKEHFGWPAFHPFFALLLTLDNR